MAKKRILIVDDSALMRQVLTSILNSDASVEVVGTASDPVVAWEKIRLLNPDLVTLDVEMPRMDGLTFLEKLMRARPMPVLMISSLTERGCETTLRALELGAVDFVTKPKLDVLSGTQSLGAEILAKVHAAASARVCRRASAPEALPATSPRFLSRTTHQVIAVGASTGGTEALRVFLTAMPADAPGMVVVQHMPASFTRSFADRLNSLCRVRVSEARDGDHVIPGHVLIAPGDLQMEVRRSGAETHVRVWAGERVNCHRPSVDVLFHSCAKQLGANAVAVIMTGMGADGAQGMLAMRRAGARTLAQDEATSVVFGMPKEAIAIGAAERVSPLPLMCQHALDLAARAN